MPRYQPEIDLEIYLMLSYTIVQYSTISDLNFSTDCSYKISQSGNEIYQVNHRKEMWNTVYRWLK